MEDNIQVDPAGFHLIPLPFADDIRQPTVDRSAHCEYDHAIAVGILSLIFGPQVLQNFAKPR